MPLSELGPYRVLRLLKAGGEGAVYAAEDRRLGRRVALKLRPLPNVAEARQAVIAEARLLGTLSHPNIVRLYDVVETGDAVALVMEYVAGNDLEELLAAVRLDLESTLQVGLDLCSALAEAHGKGVIHGDLKAANVLIDASGRMKLTDFGVAFRQQEMAGPGGTLSLLAPEQRAGRDCDARTDLYALGSLLFRLLSGQLPTGEPTGDPAPRMPSLAAIGCLVPPPLDALIGKLLDPDPSRRPSSALQVRQSLLALARGFPASQGAPVALQLQRQHASSTSRPDESREGGSPPSVPATNTPLARYATPLAACGVLCLVLWLWLIGNPLTESPPATAVVLQTPVIEVEEGATGPPPARLAALMRQAVERYPRVFPESHDEADDGASELELRLRCNRQLCSSQLVRYRGEQRLTDTRILLADVPEQAWSDRLDEGLRSLFP